MVVSSLLWQARFTLTPDMAYGATGVKEQGGFCHHSQGKIGRHPAQRGAGVQHGRP